MLNTIAHLQTCSRAVLKLEVKLSVTFCVEVELRIL